MDPLVNGSTNNQDQVGVQNRTLHTDIDIYNDNDSQLDRDQQFSLKSSELEPTNREGRYSLNHNDD